MREVEEQREGGAEGFVQQEGTGFQREETAKFGLEEYWGECRDQRMQGELHQNNLLSLLPFLLLPPRLLKRTIHNPPQYLTLRIHQLLLIPIPMPIDLIKVAPRLLRYKVPYQKQTLILQSLLHPRG